MKPIRMGSREAGWIGFQDALRVVAMGLTLAMLGPLSMAEAASNAFNSLLDSVQQTRSGTIDKPDDPDTVDAAPFATEASTVRFLSQATFGATPDDVESLVGTSVSAWLREQFQAQPSDYLATVESYQDPLPFLIDNPWNRQATTFAFWKHSIAGPDQLRQRMAWALSQILVISNGNNDPLREYPEAVAYHHSLLSAHSFGNYRDLLEDITYSPGMGYYLTYMGNQKADPETGRQPDENYARELMQLFSIGLIVLDDDGTPAYPADGTAEAVELYTNEDITGLAKVFTGLNLSVDYTLARADPDAPEVLASWREPMVVDPEYHSTAAKTFLGLTIPEDTAAEDSIDLALDHLMGISSMAPFLSRQLIQRFTTSNPSSDYIFRVTQVFNSGRYTLPDGTPVGSGQRGDLAATLAAILLDPENLSPEDVNQFGKIREPVLRFTQWARAFNVGTLTPEYTLELYDVGSQTGIGQGLLQHPFRASSVFNFYRPGYVAAGTESGALGMTVPELQIINAATTPAYLNFITLFAMGDTQRADLSVYQQISGLVGVPFDPELARSSFVPDYTTEEALADDVPALVNHLNLLLAGNALSQASQAEIIELVEGVPEDSGGDWRSTRAGLAVTLVMIDSDYLIQR